MKTFLMIFMAWACLLPIHAQTKAEADSAYAAENYGQAAGIYAALLEKGVNADIYYNLGNCCYKTDNIAGAILNYERALLLAPGNADIRFNLELARAKTVDKIVPESEMFFVTWFWNLVNVMGMDAWARTAAAAFALACLLALFFFFGSRPALKKLGFFGTVALLAVVALGNVFASLQHDRLDNRTGAVVMSGSVVVKSTPNDAGTDLFVLHEGTRVEVIDDSMKEWKEIRLADGKIGWMPAKDLEVI